MGPETFGSELTRLEQAGWSARRFRTSSDGVRFVDEDVSVNYPEGGLETLGLDGGQGYWFDHRAREVIDAVTAATDVRAIWDIGAGSGSMSQRLATAGFDVVSVEPLAEGATAIAGLHCSDVFCGALEGLHLPDASIPAAGLFDVIEHLDEPHLLMEEIRRVLMPAGVVVVTVPAFPALWSNSDEIAGHRRRYTRATLDTFMQSCGMTTESSRYIFASLVPAAFALRTVPYRLGRRRDADAALATSATRLDPNPRVRAIAEGVLRTEHAVARRVPLPFGLTVLGVYRLR